MWPMPARCWRRVAALPGMDAVSYTHLDVYKRQELITLVGSLTLALATSKLTARSEVLKAYREKRVETYDELISFLDAFRENPDWALCPDFYSKSLVLSNHARVYGSKGVQDAMRTMLTSLNKDYESYKRDLKDLHDKHFCTISNQPDDEHSPEYADQLDDLDACLLYTSRGRAARP